MWKPRPRSTLSLSPTFQVIPEDHEHMDQASNSQTRRRVPTPPQTPTSISFLTRTACLPSQVSATHHGTPTRLDPALQAPDAITVYSLPRRAQASGLNRRPGLSN